MSNGKMLVYSLKTKKTKQKYLHATTISVTVYISTVLYGNISKYNKRKIKKKYLVYMLSKQAQEKVFNPSSICDL